MKLLQSCLLQLLDHRCWTSLGGLLTLVPAQLAVQALSPKTLGSLLQSLQLVQVPCLHRALSLLLALPRTLHVELALAQLPLLQHLLPLLSRLLLPLLLQQR